MNRRVAVTFVLLVTLLMAVLGSQAPGSPSTPGCYADTAMWGSQSRLTDQIIIEALWKLIDSAEREPAVLPDLADLTRTELVCEGARAATLVSDQVNVWIKPDTLLTGPSAERLALAMQGLYDDHTSVYNRFSKMWSVSILAHDITSVMNLRGDELNDLLRLIKDTVPISLPSPLPGIRFPNIHIGGFLNGQPYSLTINTPSTATDSHGVPHSLPPELWPYLMDLIWFPPLDAHRLEGLFLAEKATLFGFSGPNSPLHSDLVADSPDSIVMLRFHSLLRELLEGQWLSDQQAPSEPLTTMVFEMQDGHQRIITIGHDWFEYKGIIYHLDNLLERFDRVLSPG